MSFDVLCAYTDLDPRAEEALDLYAPGAAKVDVKGDGDAMGPGAGFIYGRLLRDWVARGEAFAIVEHDVVLHDEVMPSFEACLEPWCSYPYSTAKGGRMYEALGCVRYRREAVQAIREDAPVFGIMPWYGLDQVMCRLLMDAGLLPHHHWPMVEHQHNQYLGFDAREDGRDPETDIRKAPDPFAVGVVKTKTDPLLAIRTGLGGMQYMGIHGEPPPVFSPTMTNCPDCAGLAHHLRGCRRVETPFQFQDDLGYWPAFVEDWRSQAGTPVHYGPETGEGREKESD